MLKSVFNRIFEPQYRRPSGMLGRYIGSKMIEQHEAENEWTVGLLNAKPDDRILEIGFGGGYAIERLAGKVTQGIIAGVDISETMVAEATKRCAATGAGRIDLRMAEAGKLPFEANTFNKAFSIHSIYFWPQPLRALGEILRVLQPGGMLIVTILPKASSSEISNKDFRPYSGTELVALLHVGGFREMTIRDGRTLTQKSNFSVVGYKPAT
jgi:ubiquinone/menaquinone biosynthesis C-methylase UbiE